MTTPRNHWTDVNGKTSVWGIRFLFRLYDLCGRLTFWLMLAPVTFFYWIMDARCRNSSLKYLQLAHRAGFLVKKPGLSTSYVHLFTFSDTILDKFIALWGTHSLPELEIENESALTQYISQCQSCVVLCSHCGCIEALMRYANFNVSSPIIALIHSGHSKQFRQMLAQSPSLKNVQFMEVSELTPATIGQLEEDVKKGALIFIAGDRIPISSQSKALCELEFLGQKAFFPIGSVLISNLFHLPLVSMTSWRTQSANLLHPNRPNRYHVRFKQLCSEVKLSRSMRQAQCADIMQKYVQEIEHGLKKSPLDWFNFFDFWHPPEKQ